MFFMAVAMLASCTSDDDYSETIDNVVGNKENVKVNFRVQPFNFGDGDTRTSVSFDDGEYCSAWTSSDSIGVYDLSLGWKSQFASPLSMEDYDQNDAVDDGPFEFSSDEFINGHEYVAYSPYMKTPNPGWRIEEYANYIPVNFNRTQTKNNNYSHVNESDYLVARAKYNGSELNFEFKHLISVVKFNLTMPCKKKWTKFIVSKEKGLYDREIFPGNSYYDVASEKLISLAKVRDVRLELKGFNALNKLNLYLPLWPIKTGEVVLTVIAEDGDCYRYTYKNGITVGAGEFITCSVDKNKWIKVGGKKDGGAFVDLDLPSKTKWAVTNVAASGVDVYGLNYEGCPSSYYAWGDPGREHGLSYQEYNWGRSVTSYYYDFEKKSLKPGVAYNLGGFGREWRMPTKEEFEELIENCDVSYDFLTSVPYYGRVYGLRIANKNQPERSIFLPASGFMTSDGRNKTEYYGRFCYYWTATAGNPMGGDNNESDYNTDEAYAFCVNSHTGEYEVVEMPRYYGMSIRPVMHE